MVPAEFRADADSLITGPTQDVDLTEYPFFVTVPMGLEELLRNELEPLGGQDCWLTQGGVGGNAELASLYRFCLWSRLGSRVLLQLADWPADSFERLYRLALDFPWEEHLGPDRSFAIRAVSRKSPLQHTGHLALKVKDALVDRLREQFGRRPSVDSDSPDLGFHLFAGPGGVRLFLDLSGEPLHQRGLRRRQVAAPLKENLAASLLLRSGWPELAGEGYALVDPMCGSGTFLIEGALMAMNRAPGLSRAGFGFEAWPGHRPELWQDVRHEAEQAAVSAKDMTPQIVGFDADPEAVATARANLRAAGLESVVRIEHCPVEELNRSRLPAGPGLLVTNPPYGERLGDILALRVLYRQLGRVWRELEGWRAGLLTSEEDLARATGWRSGRSNALRNGPIDCRYYQFDLTPEQYRGDADPVRQRAEKDGTMLGNRIRKNLRRLAGWRKRENIAACRIYDRDIPEFALAADLYQDRLHLQEFRPPVGVDERLARARLEVAIEVFSRELGIAVDHVVCKERRRQKGLDQYRAGGEKGERFTVVEDGLKFLVNLTDYLDTGLFLDHRPARRLVREQAKGRRFLNLFCYTGSATVHAAAGGARETVSVDLSNTYLDWARDNLKLNGFGDPKRHRLVRADCLDWLRRERGQFDLIFCDPPTFSNSKKILGTFDVQRDHVDLLRRLRERLAPGGLLIFSCNRRGFRLDPQVSTLYDVEDWTEASLPPDFSRRPFAHQCWLLRRGEKLDAGQGKRTSRTGRMPGRR
ncbi:MAG: bifunctional 23S rRNA (guanine(2069)-N(7))-methyltransferase RlmK/23S rRNA (guanine(2445)-N(2))-methyltransferase RlmL [Geothermobacteraceae bacterium]